MPFSMPLPNFSPYCDTDWRDDAHHARPPEPADEEVRADEQPAPEAQLLSQP